MPLHLTEYVRERLRLRGDPTIARFLDVFHHRLLALFYRAWAQAQPAVQHDRPAEDRYAAWLGAGIGLGSEMPGQSSLPTPARLSQAGLLGSRSRHAEGLAKMLAGYFRVPVRIVQHVPQWLALEEADRSRLGYATNRAERLRAAASFSAQLGVSAAAGNKVRDRQYRFRIVLGPLTLAQHQAFLPGGAAWRELSDWVLQYCGPGLRWDVQLTLAAPEVPEPRLGHRVRLGVTAWIGRSPAPRDRGDLRLRPHTSFLIRSGVHHA
jgi:type VI secretion system protein ImpH